MFADFFKPIGAVIFLPPWDIFIIMVKRQWEDFSPVCKLFLEPTSCLFSSLWLYERCGVHSTILIHLSCLNRLQYQLFVDGQCPEIYTFSKNFNRAPVSLKTLFSIFPVWQPQTFHCFGEKWPVSSLCRFCLDVCSRVFNFGFFYFAKHETIRKPCLFRKNFACFAKQKYAKFCFVSFRTTKIEAKFRFVSQKFSFVSRKFGFVGT